MKWSTALLALVVLVSASVPSATAQGTTSAPPSLGIFNFLRPVLNSILGESTLHALQANYNNLMQGISSGDNAKLFAAVLPIFDPLNILRPALAMLTNYESQIWNPEFRMNLVDVLNKASSAFASGLSCFNQNLEDIMNNFTNAYVTAIQQSFAANAPNATSKAPSGFAGAPQAAVNTFRLLLDVLTSSQLQSAVIESGRNLLNGFSIANNCAQSDMDALSKSWSALTAVLTTPNSSGASGTGTSGTGTSGTGPVKAVAKPQSSSSFSNLYGAFAG